MRRQRWACPLACLVFSVWFGAPVLAESADEVEDLGQSKGRALAEHNVLLTKSIAKNNEQAVKIKVQAVKNNEQAIKIRYLSGKLQHYTDAARMASLGEDGGSLLGRRGGAMETSGSFILFSDSNTAGNDEALLSNMGEGDSGALGRRKGKKKPDKIVASAKKASASAKKATAKATSVVRRATSADPGAVARCKQVNKGTTPGLLDCKFRQDACGLELWVDDKRKCGHAWGGRVSCPDGISSKGVFLSRHCMKWYSQMLAVGTMVSEGSQASAGGMVATKAVVKHIHNMSQNSAVLLMKRAVCKKGKCAVYKSALCIDVGRPVWSHFGNFLIRSVKHEGVKFARIANDLLVRFKDKLPAKYLCSDKRNRCTNHPRQGNVCHYGKTKTFFADATLGMNAVLLF